MCEDIAFALASLAATRKAELRARMLGKFHHRVVYKYCWQTLPGSGSGSGSCNYNRVEYNK